MNDKAISKNEREGWKNAMHMHRYNDGNHAATPRYRYYTKHQWHSSSLMGHFENVPRGAYPIGKAQKMIFGARPIVVIPYCTGGEIIYLPPQPKSPNASASGFLFLNKNFLVYPLGPSE